MGSGGRDVAGEALTLSPTPCAGRTEQASGGGGGQDTLFFTFPQGLRLKGGVLDGEHAERGWLSIFSAAKGGTSFSHLKAWRPGRS